jgi:predicted RecA/RadA family phage recombinase
VPTVTALVNIRFNALIRGVIRYTKAPSQAWAEGARVFWDVANSRFTTVGPGNLFVGFAVEATGSGSTGADLTGTVYLNGVAADTGT